MRGKRLQVCLLVAVALAASFTVAQAQIIETAMRGNTVVADPAVTTAWHYNPAALAALAGFESQAPTLGGSSWRQAASADVEISGDTNFKALNWGGVQTGKSFGLGAGWMRESGVDVWGAGFGKSWPTKAISLGVNWEHVGGDLVESQNIFDLGVTGDFPNAGGTKATGVRWGAVLRDATDQVARRLDLGVVFNVENGIKVAADLDDVTDKVDRQFHIGATKRFGTKQEWEGGVGLSDGDLTLGFMYDSTSKWQGGAWKFGAAWQNMKDASSSLLIGAYGNWGL